MIATVAKKIQLKDKYEQLRFSSISFFLRRKICISYALCSPARSPRAQHAKSNVKVIEEIVATYGKPSILCADNG